MLGSRNVHLHFSGPDLPDKWPYLVGSIVVLTVLGLLRWGTYFRRRLGPALRSAIAGLVAVGRNPIALAALFLGSVGITSCYALALTAACHAFGLHLTTSAIVVVFLGGSAIGAVAPTPGGLGALEAALVAGLAAAGAPAGPAVAAVLTYRLIGYWLPIVPGMFAYRHLRHSGVL
jgi:undecaprenyl-diphosphatase